MAYRESAPLSAGVVDSLCQGVSLFAVWCRMHAQSSILSLPTLTLIETSQMLHQHTAFPFIVQKVTSNIHALAKFPQDF
jgi:hypothetical protein